MTAARPVTPAGILAARLRILAGRVADSAADEGVVTEVRALAELAEGIETYPARWTTPESADLAALAAATQRADWSAASGGLEQEMLSGHLEGRFLATLVHAVRARRVLEIGMFTGYSALAMAEALPADGVLVACEIDADVAAFAQRHFDGSSAGRRIDVRVGPARDTLDELARSERFDLVFVDADKPGYEDYVAAVLHHDLLAPHGLLCVDNTLLQGEPWTSEGSALPSAPGAAIARFNKTLAADPRVEQVIVPLRDGVTLARLVDTRGDR